MDQPVNCPQCEGRGKWCEHATDAAWSELTLGGGPCDPCDYCNGRGKVTAVEAEAYDPHFVPPFFPYHQDQ
jgi:hypothetical protein